MVVRPPHPTQQFTSSRRGSPRPASVDAAADGPSIAGVIVIDHRFLSRRNASSLADVWPGSVVQFNVGGRPPEDVSDEVRSLLARAVFRRRLHMQVIGHPDTVKEWVRELHTLLEAERIYGPVWEEIS